MKDVINHIDLETKRIYLEPGTREFHPVDDLYRQLRYLRATDESYRGFDMPVFAAGNMAKGGGKFTPRLAIFRGGWKIVPEDVSHILYVTGEQITDEGEAGAACFDLEPISASSKIIIQYEPPSAEIIETGVSGLTEEESNRLMEVQAIKAKTDILPTEPELAATHGMGSWEGATPSQVWGHDNRRLSSRDIDSEEPGEHLPSEEQVQSIDAVLNAIKGLGWTTETLKTIMEKLDNIKIAQGAHFRG